MTTETIEAPAGQDAEATTPAVEAQKVEQTPAEAPADTEKPEAEAAKPEAKKLEPWMQRKIDKLTARAKTAEAEVAQFRQAKPAEEPDSKPVDVHVLAEQIAESRERQRMFDAACNTVYQAGVKEYKADFQVALGTLTSVLGEDYVPFLGAVVDSGVSSPAVLMHFAQNPEEAAAFTELGPRAQGREIARIEASLEVKRTAKPTSAPAPISAVGGAGSANKSIEEMSMSEYMAYRQKKRK